MVARSGIAFALAARVDVSPWRTVLDPFSGRARPVVGTLLIAFHLGVRSLPPIPQHIARLVAFSCPWKRSADIDTRAPPARG